MSTEYSTTQFLVGKTRSVLLISKNSPVSLENSRLKRFLRAPTLPEDVSSLDFPEVDCRDVRNKHESAISFLILVWQKLRDVRNISLSLVLFLKKIKILIIAYSSIFVQNVF